MLINSFHVRNFRRLKDVHIDLDVGTSIFVGSNNSGKTSATQIFQLFLGSSRESFSIHDFSADCWEVFDEIGLEQGGVKRSFPTISLDIWFNVNENDIHRVISLLPNLEWKDAPIGVRLEYAPKDTDKIIENFHEANKQSSKFKSDGYHPWPKTFRDYLEKKLNDEYKIFYYVLDHGEFDEKFQQKESYVPFEIGDVNESGKKILNSLIKVDFLNAQRYLSDTDSKGRAEDLSKRLSRFYERNLQKHNDDFEAVKALANSEKQLNIHLATVFKQTLDNLNKLGYPGFADPHLVIKSAFEPESILTQTASVHYALKDPGELDATKEYLTLPDKYNGLGFKNLIYMVIEVLDFHQRWADMEENRPLLHLVIIEEPEAHLHAQLQQVFIRKILEIIPLGDSLFLSQLIVTTHSPHIVYERSFEAIRYFRRSASVSQVLNLSTFLKNSGETRDFLLKYMKLTHCDLFFADAAILVEGNVERLLLPLIIEKAVPKLQSCYLSILELGGAFAHIFKELIQFLGITTLIITDLDSVYPNLDTPEGVGEIEDCMEDDDEDSTETKLSGACMSDFLDAVTSNQTLITWLPCLKEISKLALATAEDKAPMPTKECPTKICVAYQTPQPVIWNKESIKFAGRTFEEAFAFDNLAWCQNIKQKDLKLRVRGNHEMISLRTMIEKIHKKVKSKSFKKTDFALALMMADADEWVVPVYIDEGLKWLSNQLIPDKTVPNDALTKTEVVS